MHQNDCHGISIRGEEEARDKRREMKDVTKRNGEHGSETLTQKREREQERGDL